jgi:GNAT superfamily N-acetyltransferase
MQALDDPLYRLEPLASQHGRSAFHCGVEALDTYLKTQASQEMRGKASAIFVLVTADSPTRIAGYFTLCACGLAPGTVPEGTRKHLPRYPQVSATLLGRLAVATELQGRGLGAILLAEALRKAWENDAVVGSSMVVADAIDERAARFYRAHGFNPLPESMRLMLPMRTIAVLMQSKR